LSGQYIRNGDAIAVISYERIEEEEEEKLPITILLFPLSSCREREEKETKEMRETNNKEVGIYNITNTTTTDYIGGLLALSTKSRWTHDTIHTNVQLYRRQIYRYRTIHRGTCATSSFSLEISSFVNVLFFNI
jgi:hypothetical protein